MSKYFILGMAFSAIVFINIITAYPQGQPGAGGGQDSCAQYQTQCVDGSNLIAQGASSGVAAFPNNPLPVNQVNMTAMQQMPYCQAMAQACQAQGASPPTPSAPAIPAAPGAGGFYNSFKSLFSW